MKKIALFIVLAIALSACQKFEITGPPPPDQIYTPEQPTQPTGYAWSGCNPRPVEELGRSLIYSNVFDYRFRIHIDGSQINPGPINSASFSIPHVGPNGILVYQNVANDATYTINSILDGWIYFTIRSEVGHTLKYNIAVWSHSQNKWIWFLKHGLPYDDGVNNIITFVTY